MSEQFKGSKDKPAARELAERLRRDGLRIEKQSKYA